MEESLVARRRGPFSPAERRPSRHWKMLSWLDGGEALSTTEETFLAQRRGGPLGNGGGPRLDGKEALSTMEKVLLARQRGGSLG